LAERKFAPGTRDLREPLLFSRGMKDLSLSEPLDGVKGSRNAARIGVEDACILLIFRIYLTERSALSWD
jgi:hypothetical protein